MKLADLIQEDGTVLNFSARDKSNPDLPALVLVQQLDLPGHDEIREFARIAAPEQDLAFPE